MRKGVSCLAGAVLVGGLVVGLAAADVVDDFENGVNNGHWFGINDNTWLMPDGGNPGGWLKATEGRGEPLFQFLPDPTNVFAGDYVNKGVTGFSVDLRADTGFYSEYPEGCGVTLRLYWTNGGEYTQGIEAWYTGATWPTIGAGWQPYSFPVPATSAAIPDGWNIYRGDGTPGTDGDWQYLMHNVDQVQIIYGEIGYAFPIRTWNIGMDNAHLYAVPEPATSMMLLIAGSLLIGRLRRR
jgi:hypothetical protein